MNPLIPLYVTLSTFIHQRVEALKEREDRGVTAVEYGGLILVITVILVALTQSQIGETLGKSITDAIKKLFSKQA